MGRREEIEKKERNEGGKKRGREERRRVDLYKCSRFKSHFLCLHTLRFDPNQTQK